MKWNNKGHEFDDEGKRLYDIFSKKQNLIIFGAGIFGKELASILKMTGRFLGFIDNDDYKQQKEFCGYEVISFAEYMQRNMNALIVIAANQSNSLQIEGQLERAGLVENEDFFIGEDFKNNIFPILYAYYFNKSYVDTAQISLTERCTLKCEKCAHGCYAVKNDAVDLTLKQAKKSADMFFSRVDCSREFHLIGGEPLLYNSLEEIITYIGEKYRNKIVHFCITTNGTIVPNENILIKCKKYGVEFRISNYSESIPNIRKNIRRLTMELYKYGIAYILNKPETTWMDYGFEYVRRPLDNKNELINVFDECRTPCREVRENRFYYCVMARSVSENLGYNIGKSDYLNLEDLPDEKYAIPMLEFSLGYSEKGYLDMCSRCNGRDAYKYIVPAGKQYLSCSKGNIDEIR